MRQHKRGGLNSSTTLINQLTRDRGYVGPSLDRVHSLLDPLLKREQFHFVCL